MTLLAPTGPTPCLQADEPQLVPAAASGSEGVQQVADSVAVVLVGAVAVGALADDDEPPRARPRGFVGDGLRNRRSAG